MNHVFKPYLRRFVLVFFDDILIYSPTWEEHIDHLQAVLEVMRLHSLHANFKKCSFGATKINYLGHVISKEGVTTEPPDKIRAILDWPQPEAIEGFPRSHWILQEICEGLWQAMQTAHQPTQKRCFFLD